MLPGGGGLRCRGAIWNQPENHLDSVCDSEGPGSGGKSLGAGVKSSPRQPMSNTRPLRRVRCLGVLQQA